jgi:hypothetical protein
VGRGGGPVGDAGDADFVEAFLGEAIADLLGEGLGHGVGEYAGQRERQLQRKNISV